METLPVKRLKNTTSFPVRIDINSLMSDYARYLFSLVKNKVTLAYGRLIKRQNALILGTLVRRCCGGLNFRHFFFILHPERKDFTENEQQNQRQAHHYQHSDDTLFIKPFGVKFGIAPVTFGH